MTPTPYYKLTAIQQRVLRQALAKQNKSQLESLILGESQFALTESDVVAGLTAELKLSQSRHAKASALVGKLKNFLISEGYSVDIENHTKPVKTTTLVEHAAAQHDDRTDAILSLFQGGNPILDYIPYFVSNGAGGFTEGEGSFEDFLETIFGDTETAGGTVTGRFPSPGFRTIDLGGGRSVDVLAEKPVNTAGAFEADRAAHLRAVIDAEIAKHPELLDACLAVKLDPEDAEILGNLIGVSPAEAQASLDRVQNALRAKKAEQTSNAVDVDINISGATSEQAEVIRNSLTVALQSLGLNGRSTLEAPKGKPTTILTSVPLPALSPLQINQCEVLFDEYVDDYRITANNSADLYLDSDKTFHQFALAAASCTNSLGRFTPINPEHFISYLVNHRG